MIRNFETVKAQLSELAAVINSFKSEAVQLRIIELVLRTPQEGGSGDDATVATSNPNRTPRRKKIKSSGAEQGKDAKKRKTASGTGAVAILTQLAETNFFDKPRTINDIIEHCKKKFARHFKANEFSGKLGRMARHDELTREKNAEKQYEYKKP